jgi:copper chaperone CopZ
MNIKLQVGGMHCQGCVGKISEKLKVLGLTDGVSVNLNEGLVEIKSDKDISVNAIKEKIHEAGFSVDGIEID